MGKLRSKIFNISLPSLTLIKSTKYFDNPIKTCPTSQADKFYKYTKIRKSFFSLILNFARRDVEFVIRYCAI